MATVWLPPARIGAQPDVAPVSITIGPNPDGGTAIAVYEDGERTIKYVSWRLCSPPELVCSFATSFMRDATMRGSARRQRWLKLADRLATV